VKKEKFEDVQDAEEETEEMDESEGPAGKKEGFEHSNAPDNGSRAEFFQLGKKYKGPNEEDDSDFHLDAGTTFMNAYKSLKPEQIAAMTKDTQELMQTQRQLMGTLSTLKPLIQDGKQMMDMFQSYFGNGTASMA
jgi:replication fork clamp-binding protein CrfC